MSDKDTTYKLLSGTFGRMEDGALKTYQAGDEVKGPVPEELLHNKMVAIGEAPTVKSKPQKPEKPDSSKKSDESGDDGDSTKTPGKTKTTKTPGKK